MNYSSGLKFIPIRTLHFKYIPFSKVREEKVSGKFQEEMAILNVEYHFLTHLNSTNCSLGAEQTGQVSGQIPSAT